MKRILPLATLGILAGCSLAPDYQKPDIETAGQYRGWSPAQPGDALPRGPWWQGFGDLTLDTLEAEIEPANPDLAAAIARYDQARALAVETGAPLLPQVSSGFQATENRQSAERPLRSKNQPNQYGVTAIGLQASYELDFWGRLHNIAQSGTALAQAGAGDLETARLGLHAELANDYVQLRGLDAQAKLLDDTVDSYGRALRLTEARHQGKIASGIDVSRARTQLSAARALRSEVSARRALFEHAIASLTGKPASSFSLAPEVVTLTPPSIPIGLPATLLQRRPDIAAAERRVFAANARIGVARAAFYPAITLGALGGYQNVDTSALFGAPYSYWSVGPSVSLPIFNNGLLEAEESRAMAAEREAAQIYRGNCLRAFQEVEDQLALLRDLGTEAAQEDEAVKAAERTLDLSLTLYRDGAVSYLDVAVAQEAALQVEQTALSLATRRLQASIQLIRALGGGWSEADLPQGSEAASLSP